MKKQGFLLAIGLLLSVPIVRAHCPLCTIGAAAAAGGAAYLGVSYTVIGLFIGAFAISTGMWFSKVIKKQIIPMQVHAIVALSFITTIIPINPFFTDLHPLFISWIGPYGTTIGLDFFLLGSILGGLITLSTPILSSKVTHLRNGNHIPFQGIILTLSLLLTFGLLIQFLL
jgi:hypothetical protein